ncbi:GAF domain-containing sensor histidine kinase [Phenylobacterium sp.]|uniref:GAF domain-containing sensor histidine kinase n=1 Tax=Phenylobacterium sp. TaxID=1871053 RepID=UPI0025E192B1|nr:GAF domain-containing sensor histidine kinase [Phenylobacterium sp.]
MAQSIESDIEAIGVIDAIPKLLEVVCRATGMGFAAVARVTEDRWVACAVRDEIDFGLAVGGELLVKTTICDAIRASGQAVIIDDVAEDADFRGHPTPAMYGFKSYISVPIVHDGQFFGTLCAIDPRPARLKASTAPALFELFAELIGAHLAARERLAQSQEALLNQREAAELREQFIAVMGHDLRNPLASVDAAARLLQKTPLNARAQMLVHTMQRSVQRMAGLIDNVLDLARGRLGGGFEIERRRTLDLRPALQQVIDELQLAHPQRRIEASLQIDAPIDCDGRRIAQLVSNLLANAMTHGSQDAPIRLQARTTDGAFELAVANSGDPIPEAAMQRLFQPFARAALRPHQQGLGLGLYICAEIARAHHGTLEVASDAEETRFTFRMPLVATGSDLVPALTGSA